MAQTRQELRAPVTRELNFYGEGKAESIDRGFAILSMRKPRSDYEFTRGERILANCVDDGKKIPVVVLENQSSPLSEFEVPVMALDGVFSHQQAVEMLKPYPGYENITTESEIYGITFVEEKVFDALTPQQQSRLISEPIIDLMHEEEFRHLFLPTMCFWITYWGGGAQVWSDFLEHFGLMTPEEIAKMRTFEVKGSQVFEMLRSNPQGLQKIALNPNAGYLFDPLILGKFD